MTTREYLLFLYRRREIYFWISFSSASAMLPLFLASFPINTKGSSSVGNFKTLFASRNEGEILPGIWSAFPSADVSLKILQPFVASWVEPVPSTHQHRDQGHSYRHRRRYLGMCVVNSSGVTFWRCGVVGRRWSCGTGYSMVARRRRPILPHHQTKASIAHCLGTHLGCPYF